MANNVCEYLIARDINIACEDMVAKGLESDGIIINRADVDFTKTLFD